VRPARRAWLSWLAAQTAAAGAGWAEAAAVSAASTTVPPREPGIRRGRALRFPRDHGAHPGTRTEWWYVTGWLGPDGGAAAEPTHGFQVTFFRSKVASARDEVAPTPNRDAPAAPGATGRAARTGRFEPRHLLFAHAALTDLAGGRHQHAQRIARWNGDPAGGPDRALLDDARVDLARWRLWRDAASPWQASTWHTDVRAEGFALQGTLQSSLPPLLQGDGGFSRKGPQEQQASHYYSLPQLDARLALEIAGRRLVLRGHAWLDHEWSDELLHPQAVGWDWIGINLLDGGALTAFRLRRADGSTLWAGGSFRAGTAGAPAPRIFDPAEVAFEAVRHWRSAATNTSYPTTWSVHTPAGRHIVRALLDAQELDSRSSTGAVYWEGLAELLDAAGRRIGLGYLEMTGYAAPIRLG
jgi:predicted secreted hydrolase